MCCLYILKLPIVITSWLKVLKWEFEIIERINKLNLRRLSPQKESETKKKTCKVTKYELHEMHEWFKSHKQTYLQFWNKQKFKVNCQWNILTTNSCTVQPKAIQAYYTAESSGALTHPVPVLPLVLDSPRWKGIRLKFTWSSQAPSCFSHF